MAIYYYVSVDWLQFIYLKYGIYGCANSNAEKSHCNDDKKNENPLDAELFAGDFRKDLVPHHSHRNENKTKTKNMISEFRYQLDELLSN